MVKAEQECYSLDLREGQGQATRDGRRLLMCDGYVKACRPDHQPSGGQVLPVRCCLAVMLWSLRAALGGDHACGLAAAGILVLSKDL